MVNVPGGIEYFLDVPLAPYVSVFPMELINAAGNGDVEQIKYLLEHGYTVDDRTGDGQTALCIAVKKDQLETARFLLDSRADVNVVSYEGMFPLSTAVAHRNMPMVELLLERGASVHFPAFYDYFPPIHQAAMSGNFVCMDYLLQAGANVNQVDRYLGAVLQAVYDCAMDAEKKLEIMQFLLSRGADPNIEMRNKTAAKHAVERKDVPTMKLLIVSGAKVSPVAEDPDKVQNAGPEMVDLVEKTTKNPLKLQHLTRQIVVSSLSQAARAKQFSGKLDESAISPAARLGLPPKIVNFLEFKTLFLRESLSCDGDEFI